MPYVFVANEEQKCYNQLGLEKLDGIFEKNVYMQENYPGDTSMVLEKFCLYEAEGECCDYMDSLIRQLALEYGFAVRKIVPAKRGFFGETWKIETDAADYFAKIDYWAFHQESYKNSLSAVAYMTDKGLSFIPQVIRTTGGQLYCSFRQGVMAVFAYVQGENREDYPVEWLFERLARVYQLDPAGVMLEREDFGTSVLHDFQNLRKEAEMPAEAVKALDERETVILEYAGSLRRLSDVCSSNLEDFHITHGDAGGNCIVDGNRLSVIDWDSVKYAPIERDAWFFLCDSGQIDAINAVLERHGIPYRLKWERLCYYCHYSFFYYLTEYMQSILSAENSGKRQEITENMKEYLAHGWIYGQLEAAGHSTLR